MLYLVTGEYVEVGGVLPPEQVAANLEQVVLPSLAMIATWVETGKAKGGVFAGERAGVFVLEAASNEEVGQLLASLPFWGLVKWHVRPLQTWRSAIERDRSVVQHLKAKGKP
ncbi:MAG: hypothetical protein HY710_10845 [Candidatus Latescibacteria bacterium]|nr:hypothetical protein [Candidatus Latescibacterota bacterium]